MRPFHVISRAKNIRKKLETKTQWKNEIQLLQDSKVSEALGLLGFQITSQRLVRFSPILPWQWWENPMMVLSKVISLSFHTGWSVQNRAEVSWVLPLKRANDSLETPYNLYTASFRSSVFMVSTHCSICTSWRTLTAWWVGCTCLSHKGMASLVNFIKTLSLHKAKDGNVPSNPKAEKRIESPQASPHVPAHLNTKGSI